MTEGASGAAEPESLGRKLRRLLTRHRNALGWLTAILLTAFSVRLLQSNSEPLTQLLAMPAWLWVVLLPLTLVNLAFTAARLAISVHQVGAPRVPAWPWFRIVSLGQFLNMLFPQLGNVYRGVALKREYAVSYLVYSGGLVTFVWLEAVMTLALGLITVLAMTPRLAIGQVPVVPVLATTLLLLFVAPSLAARLAQLLKPRAGLWLRVQEVSTRMLRAAEESRKAPRFLAWFTLWSLLSLVDQVAVLWLCFDGTGMTIDIATAALFYIVIRLSNIVIITPGNLGVTELAFGALGAGTHGGSLEHGVAAALAFRALYTLVAVACGVGFGGLGLIGSMRATTSGASGSAATVDEVSQETEQRDL